MAVTLSLLESPPPPAAAPASSPGTHRKAPVRKPQRTHSSPRGVLVDTRGTPGAPRVHDEPGASSSPLSPPFSLLSHGPRASERLGEGARKPRSQPLPTNFPCSDAARNPSPSRKSPQRSRNWNNNTSTHQSENPLCSRIGIGDPDLEERVSHIWRRSEEAGICEEIAVPPPPSLKNNSDHRSSGRRSAEIFDHSFR